MATLKHGVHVSKDGVRKALIDIDPESVSINCKPSAEDENLTHMICLNLLNYGPDLLKFSAGHLIL